MAGVFKLYQTYLHKYPFLVQTIQTSVLMGAADVLAQIFVEKKTGKQYDVKRTLEFVAVGGIFVGPSLVLWFRELARRFGQKPTLAVTLKKLACDQLLFAPPFMVVFIITANCVQGKSFEYIKGELEEKFVDFLISNYVVWPIANFCNFYLMPLIYQVLFANIVFLFWSVYLSWKTRQTKDF